MKRPTIFRKGYRQRLRKAIKNKRYIDVDYFSRSFDDHLATILPQVYDIVDEHIYLEDSILQAAPKMKQDCEIFLECLYDRERNKEAKERRDDICLFIKNHGRYLWW